jgi:malonate transporter MadL subunit
MKIYGVAILAACFLVGQCIGDILGLALGTDGNVGGVGFAMLIMILLNDWLKKKDLIQPMAREGILFWSAMYIPVVVAMSSVQNVKAALTGGWVALVVGVVATGLCLALVPAISKIGQSKSPVNPQNQ